MVPLGAAEETLSWLSESRSCSAVMPARTQVQALTRSPWGGRGHFPPITGQGYKEGVVVSSNHNTGTGRAWSFPPITGQGQGACDHSSNHRAGIQGRHDHFLQSQYRDREGVVISSNHRVGTGRAWSSPPFLKYLLRPQGKRYLLS